MSYNLKTGNFLDDLERVVRTHHEIANHLSNIAETLNQADIEGEKASGKLGLERESEDINLVSNNLRKGVFRLLVLGDLKRGKSTFINALIGEKILPSDVNPCTALLTVLRYGSLKKVTVYFKDDREPEQLDFERFKQQYTIDPDEAKRLEADKKLAFPNVNYAVVEYPLPLLQQGIEIVDTPGLNDTEARNELSLTYINNCHAILFVFRASQPCTLEERRYLENYLKGRGLSVFFLINAWDKIRKGLIDPDDSEELEEAEEKLRKVFHSNLSAYCQVDGHDIYDERVFELSSLEALRRRVKNPEDLLEGTGFPEFIAALNTFLTKERAVAQLRQAKTLARQTYTRLHEAIERRIPLLDRDVNELKQRISSGIKLLTELLNIEGIKVISQRQHEGIGIIFQIEPIGQESVCPRCGTKSHIDLDKSKLISILPARTQEEISQVMKGWGTEVLESIEEVSIDLWKGYKNLGTELMPKAQVVADRFHVMAQINKELDIQRKREKSLVEDLIKTAKSPEEKAKNEKVLEGLKKSKYVLLKNEEELSEEQKAKLIQVEDASHTLKAMHQLKEEIRQIFSQTKHWLTGLFQLGRWLSEAKKYFPNSQNTIIRWLDEIIAYFDNRTTSGVVEGINNKLKLIKRSAYGFRNFENYRIRCLLNWHRE